MRFWKNSVFKPTTMITRPIVLSAFILFCFSAGAQTVTDSAAVPNSFLKVFVDGDYYYFDYLRTEITWVSFVRDRHEADVHVLVASTQTGSNGTDFSLQFIGNNAFAGETDTLHYISAVDATEDETRTGLTQMIKLGLIPFVAKTPDAQLMHVQYTGTTSTGSVKEPKDIWHRWVYSLSINGNISMSSTSKNYSFYSSASGIKVTDAWKTGFSFYYNYEFSKYDYSGFQSDFTKTSKGFSAGYVKSIKNHWAAGITTNNYTNTYSNYDLYLNLNPAVEYDAFPYSENTTRLFTVLYSIGPSYNLYTDTTVYNKTEEVLYENHLKASLALTQKWGSVQATLDGSAYLNDLTKNRAQLFTYFSLNLFSGFAISCSAYFDLIHDQLNLPKGDATEEEVLLELQELKTDYQFFMYFGISYTFGSIYNNVVNPRFYGVYF